MYCCFLNVLNLQLDINLIQCDVKNLGWRGNNFWTQTGHPFVSVLLKQNIVIDSFIKNSGLNEVVRTYNSLEFQESKYIVDI